MFQILIYLQRVELSPSQEYCSMSIWGSLINLSLPPKASGTGFEPPCGTPGGPPEESGGPPGGPLPPPGGGGGGLLPLPGGPLLLPLLSSYPVPDPGPLGPPPPGALLLV